MKRITPLLLFVLFSCGDKKINQKKSKVGGLEINQYQISLITSLHDHVDVSTEHVLKINPGNIDTIFLAKDTLVIKTVRHPGIYEKKDKVFNYIIRIDSLRPKLNDTIYGQLHEWPSPEAN